MIARAQACRPRPSPSPRPRPNPSPSPKPSQDRNWSPWVVDTADFEEEHADKNVDFMTAQVS